MRKVLLLTSLFLCACTMRVACSDIPESVPSNQPTPHGYGLIHLVHNDTPFPMQFFRETIRPPAVDRRTRAAARAGRSLFADGTASALPVSR